MAFIGNPLSVQITVHIDSLGVHPDATRQRKAFPDCGARFRIGIESYNVEINPDSEAIVTIGSKEGLAHLMLAKPKVSVSRGIGFGHYGDEYVCFALIENENRIRQATRGIKAMFRADGLINNEVK